MRQPRSETIARDRAIVRAAEQSRAKDTVSPPEQGRPVGERKGQVEPGGGRALLLAAAGILLSSALLPWGVLGLALEVAAIVIGVRTLRRAKVSGRPAPGAFAAVIAAGAAVTFFVLALAFVGYFYEEYDAYQTCVGRAITDSASDACRAEFERSVRERVGLTP